MGVRQFKLRFKGLSAHNQSTSQADAEQSDLDNKADLVEGTDSGEPEFVPPQFAYLDTEDQPGVVQAEAITATWNKGSLITAYML